MGSKGKLARSLFRSVLRKGLPICHPKTHHLKSSCLRDMTGKLGTEMIKDFENIDSKIFRLRLREYFVKGLDSDVDSLLVLLPTLYRYSFASSVYLAAQKQCSDSFAENLSVKDGCLLVSRLYRTPSYLREVDIALLVDKGIASWAAKVKDELESVATKIPGYEIYDVLMAFNAAFEKNEQKRIRGTETAFLLDDLLNADKFHYQLALPIAQAIMTSEILSSIGFKAFGVPFPRFFLSRILTAGSDSRAEVADDKGNALDVSVPKDLSVDKLVGRWVGIGTAGMIAYEISLDPVKMELRCAMVEPTDSDQGKSTSTHLLDKPPLEFDWTLDLRSISRLSRAASTESNAQYQHSDETISQCSLSVRTPYALNVKVPPPRRQHPLWHESTTEKNFMHEIVRPKAKLVIIALLAKDLGNMAGSGNNKNCPHIELLIDASSTEKPFEIPSPQRLYLVRAEDLERCLFLSCWEGILPISPVVYLELTKHRSFSEPSRRLLSVTSPASGLAVAQRLALNICTVENLRSSEGGAKDPQPTYWNGIVRMLEQETVSSVDRY